MLNLNEMHIYIVSLKNEFKRRSDISSQLDALNIKYTFFDAVDASCSKLISDFRDDKYTLENTGKVLTNGELACNLSHFSIYENILEYKHDYTLILEDDAIVIDDLVGFLSSLIKKNLTFDVMLLGYSKVDESGLKKLDKIHPIGPALFNYKNYNVGKVYREYTSGTVGYLITYSGAKKIIASNLKGKCLADNWDLYSNFAELKILHCRPFLIFENFIDHKSSIADDRDKFLKNNKENFFISTLKVLRGYFRYFYLRIFK